MSRYTIRWDGPKRTSTQRSMGFINHGGELSDAEMEAVVRAFTDGLRSFGFKKVVLMRTFQGEEEIV